MHGHPEITASLPGLLGGWSETILIKCLGHSDNWLSLLFLKFTYSYPLRWELTRWPQESSFCHRVGPTALSYENSSSHRVAPRWAAVLRGTCTHGVWPHHSRPSRDAQSCPPEAGWDPSPWGGGLLARRARHVAWSHQPCSWGGKPVHNGNSSQYNVEKQFQESLLFSFWSQGKQLDLLSSVGHRKKLRSISLTRVEFFSRPKTVGMLVLGGEFLLLGCN